MLIHGYGRVLRSKVLLLLWSDVSYLEEAGVFLMCVSKCSNNKCSWGFKAIIITEVSILSKYSEFLILFTPKYSESISFLIIKKKSNVLYAQHFYRCFLSAWAFITSNFCCMCLEGNFRIAHRFCLYYLLYIFKCWLDGMLHHIFITTCIYNLSYSTPLCNWFASKRGVDISESKCYFSS